MQRILALDIGSVRIGVAVSDPTLQFAIPLEHINLKKTPKFEEEIAELCREYNADTIAIGMPLQLDGTQGAAVRRTRRFAAAIKKSLPHIKLVRVDERLSTAMAERSLQILDVNTRKQKNLVDSMAAALILESYLALR